MASAPTAAVIVEKACKYYGRKNKADYKVVLDHLSMTVEKGMIYGLLGPSGCGKTTLLSCIVGRRKLDSGNVWVLGGKPGEKGSGVPGPRVGYMPQEIALVAEFTVRSAIYYFGRIYGLKPSQLEEKFEFLSSLLELPSGGRLINTLSGGQQRRVSLAAALVHDPELLILDEPTVGLDPVLRERIWEFLADTARKGTTVIITTHYIDETKQAHKIGLLRDGQLLAENTPEEILRQLECDTLEEAFFKLALRQHEELLTPRRSTLSASPDLIPESRTISADSRLQSTEDFNVVTSSTDVLTKKELPKNNNGQKSSRYRAVFLKSVQQFSRHPGGLIFSVLFPLIQIVAFFSAIGHDPWDLELAVFNEEAAYSRSGWDACKSGNLSYVHNNSAEDSCEFHMVSCWFLEEMEKQILFPVQYNSTEAAERAVTSGAHYAGLHFKRNFSEALATRLRETLVEDEDVLDTGTVHIWIDMTNHQISNFVKSQLYKTYEKFTKRVMRSCGRDEHVAQVPINFLEPFFGSKDPQYVAYMAPGVMITILFFLAAVVTSTLMISDRLEGVWERSAVAGVKAKEMLQVHIGIQSVVILLQTIEIMVLSFAWYGLPSKGSLTLVGALMFLQGLSGMCYGFLLSVVCSSFTVSFFIATGSFYPMILLCGILWPLEAMPPALRAIALMLPFTFPTTALRDLMQKGSVFTDRSVYVGFIVTLVWIGVTLAMCFLRLRLRKM